MQLVVGRHKVINRNSMVNIAIVTVKCSSNTEIRKSFEILGPWPTTGCLVGILILSLINSLPNPERFN